MEKFAGKEVSKVDLGLVIIVKGYRSAKISNVSRNNLKNGREMQLTRIISPIRVLPIQNFGREPSIVVLTRQEALMSFLGWLPYPHEVSVPKNASILLRSVVDREGLHCSRERNLVFNGLDFSGCVQICTEAVLNVEETQIFASWKI